MWTAGKIVHSTQGQMRVRGVDTPVSTLAQPVGLMKRLVASDWCYMDIRLEDLTNRILYCIYEEKSILNSPSIME